ncbi:MAG: hypothetical protein V3W44_00755 [Dehalococcoidales bacterium]
MAFLTTTVITDELRRIPYPVTEPGREDTGIIYYLLCKVDDEVLPREIDAALKSLHVSTTPVPLYLFCYL